MNCTNVKSNCAALIYTHLQPASRSLPVTLYTSSSQQWETLFSMGLLPREKKKKKKILTFYCEGDFTCSRVLSIHTTSHTKYFKYAYVTPLELTWIASRCQREQRVSAGGAVTWAHAENEIQGGKCLPYLLQHCDEREFLPCHTRSKNPPTVQHYLSVSAASQLWFSWRQNTETEWTLRHAQFSH